jgi:hypothetical protein
MGGVKDPCVIHRFGQRFRKSCGCLSEIPDGVFLITRIIWLSYPAP